MGIRLSSWILTSCQPHRVTSGRKWGFESACKVQCLNHTATLPPNRAMICRRSKKKLSVGPSTYLSPSLTFLGRARLQEIITITIIIMLMKRAKRSLNSLGQSSFSFTAPSVLNSLPANLPTSKPSCSLRLSHRSGTPSDH